ncbi:hypothetical protein [Halomonas sp. JS92-SW72]|uniref:hypothetical protein n=1 Tax=Halomonas sp. JS92-SW72 TaxID=2306583 RepID=UPI000E5B31A0|nr:hypothetical protein [Halomonas sp. JS92-SW72]AXY41627.1 hypothetical protein D1793_05130 [Halomonas sp. JS92-SW72]
MSRKPVHLEAQGPKGDRQTMWEVVRRLHADELPISAPEIRGQLSGAVPLGRVRDYVTGLERAGYLARLEEPRKNGEAVHYRLDRDVGVEAPRVNRDGRHVTQGLAREQLWRTLKILGDFSAAELADAASTPAVRVAEPSAAEYCHFLERAGYLRITRQASPGIAARYRLVPSRWSGPRPPMIQRVKQLYDPNLGEVVYTREPSAEGGAE